MDEEQTAGYREPCGVCSAVDWGVSDEGRFYCRSCHNVIERTREVVDPTFTPGSSRISTIGRGTRNKRPERGRQWVICEGFQFILRNQASALLTLGVSPRFKDEVLSQLWRIYLQKSRQAYTNNPVRTSTFKVRGQDSDSDSAAEMSVLSASETDGDTNASSTTGSIAESSSDWSQCSGSLDASSYLSARLRRTRHALMTMKKTLALLHLALVWIQEPLTLSDLLRLVNEGHVPYVNAYEELPEEMKLEGKDALIFRVESVPSHRAVHKEAQTLILFLQLPAFPPISRQSLLHPTLLSLRYLMDANLPDDLHPWVCRVMECAGMSDQALHTFDRLSRPVLPRYDLQAAALVIVTVKLLFGLDDHTEWDLSNEAADKDDTGHLFSVRRWFRLVQTALMSAQRRRDQQVARKQWSTKKPLHPNSKKKCVVMKRKRIAEQLQICFEKLSSRPAGSERDVPSSFRFCWGDGDGADGPSMHQQQLVPRDVLTPSNSTYWHPPLRACKPRKCRSHYWAVEEVLPRSFIWLLRLFSFLLDVQPAGLYEEVLRTERRLLAKRSRTRKTRRNRERGEEEEEDQSGRGEGGGGGIERKRRRERTDEEEEQRE